MNTVNLFKATSLIAVASFSRITGLCQFYKLSLNASQALQGVYLLFRSDTDGLPVGKSSPMH